MQLQGQHILILGLGASGLAMARWCAHQGAEVTVADTREQPPQLAALQAEWPGVRFVAGPFTAALVEGTAVRAVFRSPGLAPEVVAPVVDAARAMGLWQGGELSLFAQALQTLKNDHGYAPQVLAITGTNGKTTVTSLTGQLVARAGKTVKVAGNIGPTLLDTLSEALAQAQVDALALEQQEREADEAEAARLAEEAAQAAEHAQKVQAKAQEKTQDAATEETAQAALTPEVALQLALEDGEATAETLPEDLAAKTDAHSEVPAPALQVPTRLSAMARVLPQVWVLELSSFQLDSSEGFEPSAATVLNVSQDHLDWHGSMTAYAAAKARIFGQQGLMVLNREDPQVLAMRPEPIRVKLQKPVERACVLFGGDMPQRPGDYGIEVLNGMAWLVRALEADETRKRRKGEEEELFIQRLMPADALRIRGRHNAINALAALALAHSAGCALAPMLYGLREYRGEPHRVEPIAIVDEVEYFDDSKGTNVGATVAALQGLGADRRVVVILGGDGKGQDFSPLLEPVSRHVRGVVLIGRDAALIREALSGCGVPMQDAVDLPAAVQQARDMAQPADAVLMSPACASLDMFRNYEHRAEVFRQAVALLAEHSGVSMEGAL
ncbi:UDP-N-acetylmuramoyl-L-alanine--D-glutamate ligase [Limnohabitans radicicola]|uniref:UDP-N-acetylmuramoylalanine--D-glutamate ligase n=1 Tax=Limnohabitans radicicola TaxID=2771427 RepID=A0A927IMQ6_9BURK|nr:UDP-N-acetylmuramoyl-L-alanine--D-glutamate ligase [Limnohabitans radicicola]MBD8051425.1 UDP-N-acetylmuramoyl-L-alanine--D-glutamate ligase [Limnohabitans radicicola]